MRRSPTPGIVRATWIAAQAGVLRPIARVARRSNRLLQHLITGIDGEREAIVHVRAQDYIVVARRWRDPKLPGDLDLIASDQTTKPATLCFVEIKTPSTRDFVPAKAAVDTDKQRTMHSLARAYLRHLPESAREVPIRFDVLSVYLGQHPGHDLSFDLNKGALG